MDSLLDKPHKRACKLIGATSFGTQLPNGNNVLFFKKIFNWLNYFSQSI